MTLLQALEDAICVNPHDRAARSACADFLIDQSNPCDAARGEFIAVQMALEDGSLPAAKRDLLRACEHELLTAHQREWLGDLAPFLVGGPGAPHVGCWWAFAGGWLDSLHISFLDEPFARCLADAPQARLLRSLAIDSVGTNSESEPEEDLPVQDEERPLFCLARSSFLGNIRVLRLGEAIDEDSNESYCVHCWINGYLHLVRRLPQLEELCLLARAEHLEELFSLPLSRLRILQLYHQHSYPLQLLADNPAMANLTTLLCHPASYAGNAIRIGLPQLHAVCHSPHLGNLTHLRLRLTELNDEGCLEIVESGILKRLKVLDLNLGSITDEGARELAACPDLRRLELLDLGRNALTVDGIAALQATGVRLQADNQHTRDDDRWFDIGDIE